MTGVIFADFLQGLDAVLLRHHDVEDHTVIGLGQGFFDGSLAVIDGIDIVSRMGQDGRQSCGHFFFIFS